ncbi:MAG: DUF1501 domain-containing protein, partial [Planctomycetota bacterium]|nr:DUF1501 domain-containing protein [Planctomycetota bacterium]
MGRAIINSLSLRRRREEGIASRRGYTRFTKRQENIETQGQGQRQGTHDRWARGYGRDWNTGGFTGSEAGTVAGNSTGGRDHWPNCFSVAMAGGGIKGGQVEGSSDALGEFVKDRPITPGDLASTIYTLLGIDPSHELQTPDGRPIRITPPNSKVIKELLA